MKTWRWHAVRLELAIAIVAIGVAVFLLAAEPHGMGPYDDPFASWVTWAGLAGAIVGLGAMIRIYRADPEARPSPWRFFRRGR